MQVRSMRVCLIVLSIAILLCWSNMAVAHQYDQQDSVGKLGQGEAESSSVVTVRELTGPTKTEGIESVKALGIVDLGAEFPSLQGHQMRARIFTIKPGGTVARHEHQSRPGYAYILSGKIVEHRNDVKEPLVRKAGDIAIERTGVAHWWENTFDEPVVALVVDIFKPQ